MVENSRDYRDYQVTSGKLQFIEPTKSGEIVSLDNEFSQQELQEFRKLLNIVWKKIIALDLPDVSTYDKTYRGIIQFERDLLQS
jgi:hypothetical protein